MGRGVVPNSEFAVTPLPVPPPQGPQGGRERCGVRLRNASDLLASSFQCLSTRKLVYAPRIDGMGSGGIAKERAVGAARAAAGRDGARWSRCAPALHQPGAAGGGV